MTNTVRDTAIIVGILVITGLAYTIWSLSHEPVTVSLPQPVIQTELPAVNPGDTVQLISVGDRLMDSERYEEAVRHYSGALALDPALVDVRVDRGACYYALDMYHQAISDFSIALESEPNHAIAHFNLGIVYGTLELDSLKTVYWTRFLALDSPDSNLVMVVRQYLDEQRIEPDGE